MNYLELSRTSPPGAGVRLRVAVDVLDRAARRAATVAPAGPRPTIADLRIDQRGEPVLERVGSPAHLATLLWEILALQVAPTDDLPWSDPADDLPADVLDALASLTVRPAATVVELRSRFAAALEAHAASRSDVMAALSGEPAPRSAHVHTPVVPGDPSRVTTPAPANTVQALRTLSATDLGLGPTPLRAPAPPESARPRTPVLPAPPPPRRAKPVQAVRSVLARVPAQRLSRGPSGALGQPRGLPNSVAKPLLSEVAMKLEPRAFTPTAPQENANPGVITVSMAAMKMPPSARRSEPSPALEPLISPSLSAEEPVASMFEEASDAGVQLDVRPAEIDAAGPTRGTLDPCSAGAEPHEAERAAPRRRRMWPVVASSLAAALALIAFASQSSIGKDLARGSSPTETSSPAVPPPPVTLPTSSAKTVAADPLPEAATSIAATAASPSSSVANKASTPTASPARSSVRVASPRLPTESPATASPATDADPTVVEKSAAEIGGAPATEAVPAPTARAPAADPAYAVEPAPSDPSAGY